MEALADRLARRMLELLDIPSVSRDEALIAAHVEQLIPAPFELPYRTDDCLYFATLRRPGRELVVGHLDTVPPQDNLPGRVEHGVVHGLGASDMKGEVAVMVELARWIGEQHPELAFDLALVFFGKEELSMEESPLPALFDGVPDLGGAGLAVVLEPTDGQVHGGVATNVIPDRVEVTLSFRYAPDRDPADAERFLRDVVGETGTIEELANSPSARVVVDTPLVERLRRAGDLAVAPKQAWTPVAEFSLRGIDAVNYGPGATHYAHKRDEQVGAAALVSVFETLRRFAVEN